MTFPRLFFRTLPVWGPILLVGLALAVVNTFFTKPEADTHEGWIRMGRKLHRPEWVQKGYLRLLAESPDSLELHAQYVLSLEPGDSLRRAIARYQYYSKSRERNLRTLGNLCLGLANNQKKDYLRAKLCFNRVRNRALPYLHAGIGEAEYGLNRFPQAEAAFQSELRFGGNKPGAWEGLGKVYVQLENRNALWELWKDREACRYVPLSEVRALAFRRGAFVDYFCIIGLKIFNNFTLSGFFAGLLVTAVWLAYLLQLHIFNRRSRRYLGFSFGLGMVMSLATYVMSDFQHFTLALEPSGDWVSRWLYQVFAVGAIEEFAKIFPLLLIFRMPGAVREPFDLILHASTAALGFAFIENGLYYDAQNLYIIHARAMTAVVGHMFQASLIAYALAWRRLRFPHISGWLVLGVSWIMASAWHGTANFLLHEGLRIPYLIQLTLGLYLWTLFINNTLNASPFFDTRQRLSATRLMAFLMIGLTSVLVFEYLLAGYYFGPEEANLQLRNAALSGSFLIILLAFMLSRFELKEKFWRKY